MKCSSSKLQRLQMILSSIGCAFATLHIDWKRAVAFSLCGDTHERRCPWGVPDVDCCLHKAAKWPCLPHLVQVWRCAGQLPERSSLLLPRPTWPQYVSARRSKQQGCGWSLLLEHSPLLFSKRTDRSRCIESPVKLLQGKFTRFFAFESLPDSLLSTNAITSSRDALCPFSIRQSGFI